MQEVGDVCCEGGARDSAPPVIIDSTPSSLSLSLLFSSSVDLFLVPPLDTGSSIASLGSCPTFDLTTFRLVLTLPLGAFRTPSIGVLRGCVSLVSVLIARSHRARPRYLAWSGGGSGKGKRR